MRVSEIENISDDIKKRILEAPASGGDKKMKLEAGEKYLSGSISLGALGKIKLRVFKNKQKKSENHPDYRICAVSSDGDLKQVGALWVNRKQKREEVPEERTDF